MNDTVYSKDEAKAFIVSKLSEQYKQVNTDIIKSFVENAMALDDQYMEEMGFFNDDEEAGDLIYDEEDAFNYLLSGFEEKKSLKIKEDLLEDLVDDFLETKYDFLLSKNLVD